MVVEGWPRREGRGGFTLDGMGANTSEKYFCVGFCLLWLSEIPPVGGGDEAPRSEGKKD